MRNDYRVIGGEAAPRWRRCVGVAWCARGLSEWDIPLVSAAVAVARCAASKRAERLGALSARGASVLDSAQCLTQCYRPSGDRAAPES